LTFYRHSLSLVSCLNCLLQWIKGEVHTERLVIVSAVLTFVFVVEVVMKNIAFTPRGYWQSRRNRYDLLVTVAGVIWIILQTILRVSCSCCHNCCCQNHHSVPTPKTNRFTLHTIHINIYIPHMPR